MLTQERFLPRLESLDEAVALCDRERDDFFLDAFLIQNWIGQAHAQAESEYNRRPGQRALQMGQAQCAFLRVFGNGRDADLEVLHQNLYRFSEYADSKARVLAAAIRALSIEQEVSGDFAVGRAPDPQARPLEAISLRRLIMERWCDWIDAVIHIELHARWRLHPESFSAAAQGRRSGPRKEVPAWPFQEVDECVICLWPLVKRHNWSYVDLKNVLEDVLRRPDAHPCQNEQTLTNYCTHALGLQKMGRGQTARNARPTGYEVALRICPTTRRRTRPGQACWM